MTLSSCTSKLPIDQIRSAYQESLGGSAVDSRAISILLVDDEEMVLDVGIMMLERMGFQVIGAKAVQRPLRFSNNIIPESTWSYWTTCCRMEVA